jgi:transketolase
MLWYAIEAQAQLAQQGIEAEVINIHTIKPLDLKAVLGSAQKTGCVVTAEEHQIFGGLGSAIAEALGQYLPLPIEMVGVNDSFGESGTPDELLKKYGCSTQDIVNACQTVLGRKTQLNQTNTTLV